VGGLRGASRGFVLLDVVAALAVVLTGLALVLGTVSTLGRITIRQAERVHAIIERRNADAKDRAVEFPAR
jgi:bifunctional N-acetylglucosamine-1-phosphate-uridyltransferase/glucosamine-1-phosphate-acetyltransferase GlmU-like protein